MHGIAKINKIVKASRHPLGDFEPVIFLNQFQLIMKTDAFAFKF